jgi:hypothetical protein
MFRVVSLGVAALLWSLATVFTLHAQNADSKSSEPAKAGEAAKDAAGRIDEIADASRNMTGPAAKAECVWLGQRAVGLMWRDDLDTAFRHLDLYDRFGCPGDHVQLGFRCVIRQGNIDPKATETFNARVHSCWLNPTMEPATTAAATTEKPGARPIK